MEHAKQLFGKWITQLPECRKKARVAAPMEVDQRRNASAIHKVVKFCPQLHRRRRGQLWHPEKEHGGRQHVLVVDETDALVACASSFLHPSLKHLLSCPFFKRVLHC